MKRSFKLTIDLPPEMPAENFADYIADAVRTLRGGYNPPRDDLNSVDMDTMEVSCRGPKNSTYHVTVADINEWGGL